jgi:hypothetical protein
MATLGLGGIVGAALVGGQWWLFTWRDTGNPIFPLFNAVFQSEEVAPINLMDAQFMPRSIAEALAYPFHWLVGDHKGAETSFRDARFAVVMALFVLGFLVRLARRSAIFTPRDIQLVTLFTASYLAWLGLFAIQRYAMVLELLCGPLIVLLLCRLGAAFAKAEELQATASLPINVLMSTIALGVALWSQPADWWHRPWSMAYQPEIADELKQPAICLLIGKPVAYVAPLLGPESRFYQLADIGVPIVAGGHLDRRIRAGLKTALPGGVRESHLRGEPDRSELLDRYGFEVDRSKACTDIEGARLGTVLETCPLIERVR